MVRASKAKHLVLKKYRGTTMNEEYGSSSEFIQHLREEFLQELPERLLVMEQLALQLEKQPDDQQSFTELYRQVHSLKGIGATLYISLMTAACHQWETLFQEGERYRDSAFADLAFRYIDVLAQIGQAVQEGLFECPGCQSQLEQLRQFHLQERYAVLIADSSRMMRSLYRMTLEPFPLQITTADNGLEALEKLLHNPFHMAILGGELKELCAQSIIAALRLNPGRNRRIPIFLVTSSEKPFFEKITIDQVLRRDKDLQENLTKAIESILHQRDG